jgi:hypothetical protein
VSATFALKPEHIMLLRRAFVGWQECETGAPEIDPKRPYGNSDVAGDVAEILGVGGTPCRHCGQSADRDDEALLALHYETGLALQVILSSGSFEPGVYDNTGPLGSRRWVRRTDEVPS